MDDLFNQVARRRRPGQKGFTLIELLVVIAVLAVLAFIVIFNVVGVANRGSSSACATDVKSVQTAVDSYYSDNQAWGPFTSNAALTKLTATQWSALVPQYIHTQPAASDNIGYVDANGTSLAQGINVESTNNAVTSSDPTGC